MSFKAVKWDLHKRKATNSFPIERYAILKLNVLKERQGDKDQTLSLRGSALGRQV